MWQINQRCRVVSVLTSTVHSNVAVSHIWISFVIWLYLRNTNQNITVKVCHAYLKNNILAICLTTVISLFTYILPELVEKCVPVGIWMFHIFTTRNKWSKCLSETMQTSKISEILQISESCSLYSILQIGTSRQNCFMNLKVGSAVLLLITMNGWHIYCFAHPYEVHQNDGKET